MKYKVGDIVKLRDDLEEGVEIGDYYYSYKMADFRGEKVTIAEIDEKEKHYSIEEDCRLHYWTEEMIEGLWEESYQQVKKDNEHILDAWRYAVESKLEGKLKLIDVLNKIANGELKEDYRTEIKMNGLYYKLFVCETADNLLTDLFIHLNDEVELIEPQEPVECEHEWKNYEIHRIGEGLTRKYRRCEKCRLEENIEPTDNTTEKIEELKQLDMDFAEIDFASHEEYARCSIQVLAREMIKQIDKLNEVIRYINK